MLNGARCYPLVPVPVAVGGPATASGLDAGQDVKPGPFGIIHPNGRVITPWAAFPPSRVRRGTVRL